jgi:hypothetical protein
MATIYVNKSGNDSNNGSTAVLAKLTIQAGITAAGDNGTVYVGSGSYNEKLSYTSPGSSARAPNLYADGIVTLDGSGLASGAALTINTRTSGWLIGAYTTGGLWIVKNYTASGGLFVFSCNGTNVSGFTIDVSNVIFISNSNASAIQLAAGGTGNNGSIYVHGNIFVGNFTRGIDGSSSSSGVTWTNYVYLNTFYNNTTHIDLSGTVQNAPQIYQNIFSTSTTAVNTKNSPTALNTNLYYSNTHLLNINGSNYDTLGAVQALGYEANRGLSQDPQFVDAANGVFYLKADPYGDLTQYGMYPFGHTRGENYDPDTEWDIYTSSPDNTKWYNPDSNVTKNGTTGFFELTSGTSGVIWSPVWDLSNSQQITRVDIEANQIWPTNMVDKTTSDVRPNYQTCEIRTNATSFNQDDGVISWTEVKNNIAFTTMTGRYVQIRLTLRNDDVAG